MANAKWPMPNGQCRVTNARWSMPTMPNGRHHIANAKKPDAKKTDTGRKAEREGVRERKRAREKEREFLFRA